jgi:hypothetical protein
MQPLPKLYINENGRMCLNDIDLWETPCEINLTQAHGNTRLTVSLSVQVVPTIHENEKSNSK